MIPSDTPPKQAPKILRPTSERIQLLQLEKLNNWECNFCLSLLTRVTKRTFTSLSDKQENKLREMEKDFGLSRYQGEGPELPVGKQAVIKPAPYAYTPAPKSTKQQPTPDFTDMDDDIPF